MRAAVVLLFASLASCMLFVSPEEYGSVCRFQGEDTQCGTCAATKCRAAIDACCRDSSCDATMASLDACTTRHDASCSALASGPSTLSQCIARECGAVCADLPGASKTSCREPRLGEGSACACTVPSADQPSNDFVCTARAVPQTVCCAPKGWPAVGLSCTCRALECRPTDDGCFCSLGDFTPKQRECGGVNCCVDRDTCTCRAKPCFAFETVVDSCGAAVVGCGEGQDRVESCSLRSE